MKKWLSKFINKLNNKIIEDTLNNINKALVNTVNSTTKGYQAR